MPPPLVLHEEPRKQPGLKLWAWGQGNEEFLLELTPVLGIRMVSGIAGDILQI